MLDQWRQHMMLRKGVKRLELMVSRDALPQSSLEPLPSRLLTLLDRLEAYDASLHLFEALLLSLLEHLLPMLKTVNHRWM